MTVGYVLYLFYNFYVCNARQWNHATSVQVLAKYLWKCYCGEMFTVS